MSADFLVLTAVPFIAALLLAIVLIFISFAEGLWDE